LNESTGARIGCLLNPESIVLRRQAGVAPRLSVGGLVTGTTLTDDPIIHTGGGQTHLDLDLLFDVSLAGSSVQSEDVRDLTRPLWELAENQRHPKAYGKPPFVRFVWGKSWNIPGVVIAVAERLERFTSAGLPRRSWLRMRMRRMTEQEAVQPVGPAGQLLDGGREAIAPGFDGRGVSPEVIAAMGDGTRPTGKWVSEETALAAERLDEIAFRYYGDASLWRLIADFNGISDPLRIDAGNPVELPELGELEKSL
jgi:hypothetical protein